MALRNPDIGVIGKSVVNDAEKAALTYVGRAIAKLGHRLLVVPAKGVADTVREGVKIEGGETLELERDVIDRADHTLVYPDKRLLSRLLTKYPNLQDRDDVLVIREDQLDEWVEAVNEILDERKVSHPD